MKLLHLLFTSTLVSTLSLTALGAVQRDLSFLPSAKEKTLVHSTGDVCKVGMGKKDVPDNNVPPLQMAMPPPVTTVVSTNMTNTVASVTKGN